MKHQKTIEVPAETKVVTDFITCDICHEKIKGAISSYGVNKVEIRYKYGNEYPEGGDGEEVEMDMCPKCFETRLVPWIQTFGGEPSRRKWSY